MPRRTDMSLEHLVSRFVLAMLIHLPLFGCELSRPWQSAEGYERVNSGSVSGSTVVRDSAIVSEIRSTVTSGVDIVEFQRNIVFRFVKGMSRSEAVEFLHRDGFSCEESVCLFVELRGTPVHPIQHELDNHFFVNSWVVAVVSNRVTMPTDLVVAGISTTHRRRDDD